MSIELGKKYITTGVGPCDNSIGEEVYLLKGYDYGLASDDSRRFGIKHVSMTRDSKGGYPSFTIPENMLKLAE